MFSINCKGKLVTIDTPWVMGIINVTADSFYAGSRHSNIDEILARAESMIVQGADVIDIGGQSSRPGSSFVSADEELKRVEPAITAVARRFPEMLLSVDTFYSRVAKEAVDAGASIINDISAGSIDKEMIKTAARLKVPYVLMHMKGTPQTMQANPVYENVVQEVLDFHIRKTKELEEQGIHDIIIDVGFGFGKMIRHNFDLLKNLSVFKMLRRPLLLGISRKSTIYKTLGITAEEALNGSTVLNTIGLLNGADILRVHDVKEAKEAVKLFCEYKK